MKEHLNVYNDVLKLIGNTPLVRLNRITKDLPGSYFAKVEAYNPGNSSKDRIALYIIDFIPGEFFNILKKFYYY